MGTTMLLVTILGAEVVTLLVLIWLLARLEKAVVRVGQAFANFQASIAQALDNIRTDLASLQAEVAGLRRDVNGLTQQLERAIPPAPS